MKLEKDLLLLMVASFNDRESLKKIVTDIFQAPAAQMLEEEEQTEVLIAIINELCCLKSILDIVSRTKYQMAIIEAAIIRKLVLGQTDIT